MTLPRRVWMTLPVVVLALGCLTIYNKPKLTAKEGAPLVEKRPDGCIVEVFQDGEAVARPHADLGTAVLDWPQNKIEEQGPQGAIDTLKALACESGAFIIKDLRAVAMGVGEGMIYQATLATLLGDDGKPLNAKAAGPAPAAVDAGGAPRAPDG